MYQLELTVLTYLTHITIFNLHFLTFLTHIATPACFRSSRYCCPIPTYLTRITKVFWTSLQSYLSYSSYPPLPILSPPNLSYLQGTREPQDMPQLSLIGESLGLKTISTEILGLVPVSYKIFEVVSSWSRLG